MKEILYYFADTSLWIPMRAYLRQVYFDGLENFPEGKPVMLACNHPNSFLDGVIFEDLFRRRIYTLVRGDVFLNPVTNQILRGLRLLPIFRSRDTSESNKKKGNQQTIVDCGRILGYKRCILIFPEGIAKPEKRIRRVMGGAAHMSLQIESRANFELDLHIVPVGLNYEKFNEMQTRVQASFGKPILLSEFKNRMDEDEKKLAAEISARITSEFQERILINPDFDQDIDFAQTMVMNESVDPFKLRARHKNVHESIPKINLLNDEEKGMIRSYRSDLEKNKVLDENFVDGYFDYLSIFFAIASLPISLPAFLVSKLLTYVSFKTIKAKITNRVFTDSIYIGVNMVLHWFWYSAILAICFSRLPGLLAIGCFVFVVYATHCWHRFTHQAKALWHETTYFGLKGSVKTDLQNQRNAILKILLNK